jgi:hypothetical protein
VYSGVCWDGDVRRGEQLQHIVLREGFPVKQSLGQLLSILLVRLDEFVRLAVGGF